MTEEENRDLKVAMHAIYDVIVEMQRRKDEDFSHMYSKDHVPEYIRGKVDAYAEATNMLIPILKTFY